MKRLLSILGVALLAACTSKTVVSSVPPEADAEAPAPEAPAVGLDAGDPRCAPEDVSTFAPAWAPPAAHQAACTAEQLTAIEPCALGYGTEEQCARFLSGGPAADTACTACVATRTTDPTWGPTVHTPDKRILLNTGGCIALLEPSREQCGEAKSAATSCVDAACYTKCFSDTTTTNDAQTACATDAAQGGCQQYAEADVTCRAAISDANSPALICYQDFDSAGFQAIAKVFCGM